MDLPYPFRAGGMSSSQHLSIRVREDLDRRLTEVLVVDPQGEVVGHLEYSVLIPDGIVWSAAGQGSVGILTLKIACQSAKIETLA
jgi:sugar lactone lactonase YvrE